MNKLTTNITKRTSNGFSLMELIVVIVLIAIFATIAMTRTRTGLSTIREQIAIDQVTSDIDLVRSMAFGMHETMTIVFSVNEDSYAIFKGPNNSRTAVEDYPHSDNGVISLDNSNLREVDIKSVNFNGSSELQFLPLGDINSGGSISLNDKTITVQPITGKWSIN
mgnify:FL=1|tara:strand:+ start:589 stop:1083 length:495 start_codon:yes stop_codon:yes gene_type:complete